MLCLFTYSKGYKRRLAIRWKRPNDAQQWKKAHLGTPKTTGVAVQKHFNRSEN